LVGKAIRSAPERRSARPLGKSRVISKYSCDPQISADARQRSIAGVVCSRPRYGNAPCIRAATPSGPQYAALKSASVPLEHSDDGITVFNSAHAVAAFEWPVRESAAKRVALRRRCSNTAHPHSETRSDERPPRRLRRKPTIRSKFREYPMVHPSELRLFMQFSE